MTEDMPRGRPLFVHVETNRHGNKVWYFRQGKGQRIRLPDRNDPKFDEAYKAAMAGSLKPAAKPIDTKTLKWLIERYRETAAYVSEYSPATKRQRDNIFKGVIEQSGEEPYRDIDASDIMAGVDDRASTPSQARNFLDAMRGLFRWAKKAAHVKTDPTIEVTNPKRPKTAGFAAWTDKDVDAFEARWPEGTKERVWLHVLLYTGLRRGDAVKLGPEQVTDGAATIVTEKTGTEVYIPIIPPLEHTLSVGPIGKETFIVGETRKPLTKETFGNMFREACDAAGLKGKSAHGVRKIGATRAAEDGATVHELEALFGWTGGAMASHYTKTAGKKRLSKQASEKIRKRYETPKSDPQPPHLP